MGKEAAQIPIMDEETGEMKNYTRLSARVPQFLAEYGPQQGFYMTREAGDFFLTHRPELLELYKEAIRHGHKPEDVGLPSLSYGGHPWVTFTTKLHDKDGNVVAQASSSRVLHEEKDSEKGESAAYQRLLASLGYGGESFDDDEDDDIGRLKSPDEIPAAEVVTPQAKTTPGKTTFAPAAPASAPAPKAKDEPEESEPEKAEQPKQETAKAKPPAKKKTTKSSNKKTEKSKPAPEPKPAVEEVTNETEAAPEPVSDDEEPELSPDDPDVLACQAMVESFGGELEMPAKMTQAAIDAKMEEARALIA